MCRVGCPRQEVGPARGPAVAQVGMMRATVTADSGGWGGGGEAAEMAQVGRGLDRKGARDRE